IGPDVPHLPELRLTRLNRVRRRYGSVDRDQFLIVRPANGMVLKENDPLSEISKKGIKAFATFNDDTTRHSANDLRVYIPVHMRMKPEQTNVLCRDFDLIREGFSGTNMQEDIVSISER